MDEENKYSTFTVADIERYYRGEMSAAEMHAMEKAALDDPFLAESLEGYAGKRLNLQTEINLLQDRLNERLEGAKVVPLPHKNSRRISWSSVAAILVFVIGAGYLVNQYAFKRSNSKIAETSAVKKEEIRSADTSSANYKMKDSTQLQASTGATKVIPGLQNSEVSNKDSSVNETPLVKTDQPIKDNTKIRESVKEHAAITPVTNNVASSENSDEQITRKLEEEYAKQKADKPEMKSPRDKAAADSSTNNVINDQLGKTRRATDNNKYVGNGNAFVAVDNNFRGRIIDPNNNPVPFANITATQDNQQYYADAKGYFTLVSPDTVLDIAVRSIGYADNNARLRNSIANKVVMQDDNASASAIVINTKKVNLAERANPGNFKLEEPEPVDGWANYDTYLANNLNTPEEIKEKKISGNVEVSFDVDKKGEPVNIKVEKSLCDQCDQEAIRLIKKGPKWKRKAKKRTSVNVPFQ